ncbi:HAD family hydrolase [Sneathiella chinensis]|nr:HAD family hydrolase [Sneathiella chinensis]
MRKTNNTLSTIAFDADDTLWENEQFFRLTQQRFFDLLADHSSPDKIYGNLLETERKNLSYYGYGIKGFTLSMLETALEVTGGDVSSHVMSEILKAGREMHDHPVNTLPGVGDTLDKLAGHYRIVLITKGDLFDQERKLAQSGLGDYFDAIEIVSEKETSVYQRIFDQYGDGPKKSMMVGNSLKSDVIPALEAGGWGVHVPHTSTWELDYADRPEGFTRFLELTSITDLPALLETLSEDDA